MRVPLKWLRDYVQLNTDVEELAHRLTMSGLKVESIERIGSQWQDVVIGQIVDLQPHPSSRKPMNVAQVNLGEATVTIVTAAHNVAQGDRVAVVPVGGSLPFGPDGQPMTIVSKPMAGITSRGMMASERELGISEEHAGILILPAEAPVGAALHTFMGDEVLDIETNPNRPDTLSVIGIAREVAALTGQELRLPDVETMPENIRRLDEESISVRVDAEDLCPRYSALRIENIHDVLSSPFWLKNRLELAGMRSISLIVDITNYVMLELGQPMHAFDANKLQGGEIVVRRAHGAERLRTLDGVDRVLDPGNLVIADARGAVAVAGVMGGENTEIGPETSTMVLESATFDGISVRRTAQSLNLRSEASSRFEKGLPPEQTISAAHRFLQLLCSISGQAVRVARLSDAWIGPQSPRRVAMPWRDLDRLLGISIDHARAVEVLTSLGFEVNESDSGLMAAVPFWRFVDIERSADLVEEISRIIGFDTIPATLPSRTMPPAPTPAPRRWDDLIRERLLAAGLSEAVTHSMTSVATMNRLVADGDNDATSALESDWIRMVPNGQGILNRGAKIQPVRLQNPATKDREILQMSMVPGLLDVVNRNLKQTQEGVAFFQFGHTFFARAPGELPYERRTLSIALSGLREPRTWQQKNPSAYSFYDIKGLVEEVLDIARIRDARVAPHGHAALHPGRAAVLRLGELDVAYLGELHPLAASKFGIDNWPVQVLEMDLDAVYEAASDVATFRPLPRFPEARRDIAVVVRQDVPAAEITRVIREAGGSVLESATMFDVYSGEQLQQGSVSIALSLGFRAPDATLTQEDVDVVMHRIVESLSRDLQAHIRE